MLEDLEHVRRGVREAARAERRRLRLLEGHEDRVQFILMGNEEENCNAERDEELHNG